MKQERDIFVISDLHMGDGGPRDNFQVGNREGELDTFLKYVQRENGRLIILGDLFEFWQASVSRVLVKRELWLERFADLGATYVIGNHDIDLQGFIKDDGSINSDFLVHRFFENMKKRFEETIGDKRFAFLHGHEVDPPNMKENPGAGRIGTICAGIVEDTVGAPMGGQDKFVEEELFEWYTALLDGVKLAARCLYRKVVGEKGNGIKEDMTPAQKPDRNEEMLQRYEQDKRDKGYNIAIVGHTHRPGQRGKWYYNSGCWALKKNSFVKIEKDGSVGVWDWVNGEAKENDTEL